MQLGIGSTHNASPNDPFTTPSTCNCRHDVITSMSQYTTTLSTTLLKFTFHTRTQIQTYPLVINVRHDAPRNRKTRQKHTRPSPPRRIRKTPRPNRPDPKPRPLKKHLLRRRLRAPHRAIPLSPPLPKKSSTQYAPCTRAARANRTCASTPKKQSTTIRGVIAIRGIRLPGSGMVRYLTLF
jgi:hypothetical protein